jgi:hypothetical protein
LVLPIIYTVQRKNQPGENKNDLTIQGKILFSLKRNVKYRRPPPAKRKSLGEKKAASASNEGKRLETDNRGNESADPG